MNINVINNIIADITGRKRSLFKDDIDNNISLLKENLNNKTVLVIGGAGSIGFEFIKEIIKFNIKRLFVIDINENGLAELIRDLRSSYTNLPIIKTYPISFGSHIFEKLLTKEGPFEIIANFAALKHVRSEKDPYAIEAMFQNNFILPTHLFSLLSENKPERFFCVSTDKATNPVSIMGATKKLMEDVIFQYADNFNITTARFANVAFSNGSLLNSYLWRFYKNQPIVCPQDIKRYFISPEEAGQLCLTACILGQTKEIFIPNLNPNKDLINFTKTIEAFFNNINIPIDYCYTEQEAIEKAKKRKTNSKDPYPVYFFKTDTSGEKLYEEFHSENDIVDYTRFKNIGVIKFSINNLNNISIIIDEAKKLFTNNVNKNDIIKFLEKFVSNFQYLDKGKTLDEKM
ncbi:MAG TPA: polysaccharide biosynthesis protein [Bacteroidales bacterium]|nr:polysaccharide biosynthesis protein [Bacteroidales bacterium]